MSEASETQVAKLEKQLQNQSNGMQQLIAQLEAYKASLNESLNTSIQLRTHLFLLQKQIKDDELKKQNMQKQIDSINQQLNDATKRIAELEKPLPVAPVETEQQDAA